MSLKIGDKNVSSIKISDKNVVKILDHLGNSIWQEEPGINVPLTFTCVSDAGSVCINRNGYYSQNSFKIYLNGIEKSYTVDDTINLNKNDKVEFIGSNTWMDYFFSMTGSIEASGNVNSLINYQELHNSCFRSLFKNCTSLIKAPNLPSTTLADGCYKYMFSGCTSLKEAPELPATTLVSQCYSNMFNGCTSLVKAPKLSGNFRSDSYSSYDYMFSGCTSLKEAPELPATELSKSCYWGMFENCTSLVNAPELPATTLTSSCYTYMFKGCTSLSYLKVGFTDWNKSQGAFDINYNSTSGWIQNSKNDSSCIFKCPSSLSEDRHNISAIPSNWTITKF